MSQTFTCPDPAHLARLLEGELSEAEQSDLTEHLDSCARCQQAVQELASGGRTWAEVAAYLKHEHSRTEKEPALQQAVAELAGPARTEETQTEPRGDNNDSLEFLAPSTKPESLGRLDHYEVLEVIGRGGMGMVLKAFDEALHRVVAVKVLSPSLASSATARRRFGREAKAAAAVSHDHVVTIHAVEGDKPIPYLVMQCVAGFSLEDKLARHGPLGVKEILRIGMQTAEGLAAAHKQGLVHRDIKPANILLENGVERVKITDFGLARAVDDASLTQSGVVAGTPQYMSPEQAQGEAVDHRSDLFSLGSVLYAMCTGRPPFRATGTMAVLKRVCEDTPRPIREINPDIPEWLCDIIAKLHAKRPADRFQSATEVAELLSQHLAHLQQPTLAPEPAPIVTPASGGRKPLGPERYARLRRFYQQATRRRRWLRLIGTTVLFISVASALGVWIAHKYFHGQPVAPPDSTAETWVQLFNGQDLAGWKPDPNPKGNWRVEDGILVGRNDGLLFSERGDYENFHLRLEAKIGDGASGGVLFRTTPKQEEGYLTTINGEEPAIYKTGSLFWKSNAKALVAHEVKDELATPATWFNLEIIAKDDHITVIVDGKMVAEVKNTSYRKGHLGLQSGSFITRGQKILQFRKIEIKELPADRSDPSPAVAPFSEQQAKAHQEAWAKHLGVPVETTNSAGIKLVLVPPGEFQMGLSAAEIEAGINRLKNRPNDEWLSYAYKTSGPQHKVVLSKPFYAATTQVTIGQFREFVKTKEYVTDAEKDGKGGSHWDPQQKKMVYDRNHTWRAPGYDVTDNSPVTQITWNDAVAFCNWLSAKEGLGETYELLEGSWKPTSALGYHLPTEAQWEYACRAGTTSLYFGGNDEDALAKYAWFDKNSRGNNPHGKAQPVGAKLPNAFGLFDMQGNASQLCQDFFDPKYYDRYEQYDPIGPDTGLSGVRPHVRRGGAWATNSDVCLSGLRMCLDLEDRQELIGFRIVRDILPPAKASPHSSATEVQAQWERSVAKLAPEEQVKAVAAKLKELNPGFDDRIHFIRGDGFVNPASTGAGVAAYIKDGVVTHLHVDTAEVVNISPIRALTGLRFLSLELDVGDKRYKGKFSDLSPLRDLPLVTLRFNSANVSDLSLLKDLPLKDLFCAGSGVRDLSPLRGKPLNILDCKQTRVNDNDVIGQNLEVLYTLKDLEIIFIDVTPKNEETLRSLKRLKSINGKPAADFWKEVSLEAWIKQIAPLHAEEQVRAVAAKLKELNPGFDSRLAFIQNDAFLDPDFDGGVVAYVKDGVVIHLALDAPAVADLSPVRALTGLQRLNLDLRTRNRGKYSDLSPLRDLHLKALTTHSSQVHDLSPLKDMPLEEFSCSHTGVGDLSPLKGEKLLSLFVANTPVRDLSPLRGMPLKSLFCRETKVNEIDVIDGNLEVLRTLPNLEQLDIDITQKNHESLRGLKGVKWINGIPVVDFWKVMTQELWMAQVAALPAEEQVKAVIARLKELNPGFGGERSASINEDVVTQFGFLTDHVTDISPVQALTGLQILSCKGSGPGIGKLSDLSPLKGMRLKSLDCRYTRVTDLLPLRRMPLEELDCDTRPGDAWRVAPVLRQSKTLRKINGQTTVEFWGAVDAKINEAADCLARGWDLADAKKWTEAESEFKKAVDARPDDPQVWKWRGVIQAEGKRVEQAAADFHKALELWIARTQWFAHRGKWKEAAKACEEVLACRSDDSSDWFMDAALRLQVGDVEGYHRVCREMLKRFGETKDPRIADQVAKACLLAPKAVDDLGPVYKLSDLSLKDPSGTDYTWRQVCKCLAGYRKGLGDESIQGLARGILSGKPEHAARDATALVIIAMAEQKRGKSDEARAALKDARGRIEANMPKVERGEQFGDDWHDWLRCQILLREAEKLVEKDGKEAK
jgi:formylglycine-generating enzyme required for sulfatase activity/serine/threonine protein kinase/tetratricopeptide (TPR) repeat protein